MKTGHQVCNPQRTTSFKIKVERICLSMKFPCRLFLEYQIGGQNCRSREIKIDPKYKMYEIEEEIKGEVPSQGSFIVWVKLLSSKGVSFTAGLLNINVRELDIHGNSSKIPLTKALDPSSYCQCRYISLSSPFKKSGEPQSVSQNASIISFQTKSEKEMLDQNYRIKELERQLQAVKTELKLFKIKGSPKQVQTNSNFGGKDIQKRRQMVEEQQKIEKQLTYKVDRLEDELFKANLTINRQKEMISMLQQSQNKMNDDRTELKVQLKAYQVELEEKRNRIRDLEGEKMNLMVTEVTNNKQIAFLRERVQESIGRTYHGFLKLIKETKVNQSISNPQFASFSGSGWPRENQDDSLKLPIQSHKYLSPSQLPWQDESIAFKQPLNSELSQCAMNEISISHINSKYKEQVSLLNSDLFVKAGVQTKISLSQSIKAISDFVRSYCSKIDKLISLFLRQNQKELTQLRCRYKEMRSCNSQFQKNQQSLLNHLQQLQGGLEGQLAVVAEKDIELKQTQQALQSLEERVEERDQMIRDLEFALHELEEEKNQLKTELHEKDYQFALKQEQLILSLTQNSLGAVKNLSIQPKIKRGRSQKPSFNFADYQQQKQIIYKEQIKTLELELSHERQICRQLKVAFENAELERHKHQFALKLRERMEIMAESMEISREGSEEGDGTQESRGQQLEDFNKVLGD